MLDIQFLYYIKEKIKQGFLNINISAPRYLTTQNTWLLVFERYEKKIQFQKCYFIVQFCECFTALKCSETTVFWG